MLAFCYKTDKSMASQPFSQEFLSCIIIEKKIESNYSSLSNVCSVCART